MIELLESDKIKLKILKILSDGKIYSFYLLSKLLKTNYNTIKKNCYFLELLSLVEIVKVEKEESATGIPLYRVRITKSGLDVINKIKRILEQI